MIVFFFAVLSREDQLAEASKALNDVFEFDLADMKRGAKDQISQKVPEACDRCGRHKYKVPQTDLWASVHVSIDRGKRFIDGSTASTRRHPQLRITESTLPSKSENNDSFDKALGTLHLNGSPDPL